MHQGHAMASLGLIEIGGGVDDSDALAGQVVEHRPEFAARQRIDAVGRLIEQQQLGRVDQCANQTQLLFHAA